MFVAEAIYNNSVGSLNLKCCKVSAYKEIKNVDLDYERTVFPVGGTQFSA